MRPPWLPQDDDQSSLFFMGAFFVAVLIGLLFLANVILASVAGAQEPNRAAKADACVSANQHLSYLQEKASEAGLIVRGRILKGQAAKRYIDVFNSAPPKSDVVVDEVGLMVIANAPFGLVWFARGGCVFGNFQIPLDAYFRLLDASDNRLREAES